MISTQEKKQYMFIRKQTGLLIKVSYDDVTHIRALGDYCTICTTNEGAHTIHMTLSRLADLLPKTMFVRCHRSYILNVDKIRSIEYDRKDGTAYVGNHPLPIGEHYKRVLLESINFIR